jgi:anaerobic selenocysteine-containing dehydrogenase
MPMQSVYPDFENADLVVVWGTNPATDSPPDKMKKVLAAKKRGARVLVLDQMRSHIAKQADHGSASARARWRY